MIVLELQKQANHGYPDLDLCSNSTAMQSDSVGLLDLSYLINSNYKASFRLQMAQI